MRKDKRGLALITAIAVLALMLILFGGLAMVYSSQVSRNKAEYEQSQAMLTAQSVSEMLNQVLTSSNTSYDRFKKELGNIPQNSEKEIDTTLTQVGGAEADVKITAKADKIVTNGNTKTRKIAIKVSATVNGETRSILSDYTFQLITGGSDLTKYAVYGNQIKSYVYDYNIRADKEGVELEFDGEWYQDKSGHEPIDPENYLTTLSSEDAYRFGTTSGKQPTTILSIEKDDDTLPETETELTNEDFNDYAAAKNGSMEPAALSLWNDNMQPDADIPSCSDFRSETWNSININKSCVWNFEQFGTNPEYKVGITAADSDIIIYLPVNEKEPVLSNLDIKFDNGDSEYNLFFYAYSVSGGHTLRIAPDVEIKSDRNDKEPLDVYFVSNDDIDLHIQSFEYRKPKELEAYFYLPRGQVVLYSSDNWRDKKRIEGCVVADRIALFDNNLMGNKNIGVSMEYIPPDKNVLGQYMTGSGSGTETISYKLNSYEEGGKS